MTRSRNCVYKVGVRPEESFDALYSQTPAAITLKVLSDGTYVRGNVQVATVTQRVEVAGNVSARVSAFDHLTIEGDLDLGDLTQETTCVAEPSVLSSGAKISALSHKTEVKGNVSFNNLPQRGASHLSALSDGSRFYKNVTGGSIQQSFLPNNNG